MSSAKELREARRRKILERGNDRLAFITGQVKALPAVESSAVVSSPGESGLKSLSTAGELPFSSEGSMASGLGRITICQAGLQPTSSPLYDADLISRKLKGVRSELQSLDSPPEETLLLPPSSITASARSISPQQEDIAPPVNNILTNSSKRRSNFNYAALVRSIDHSVVLRALLAFFIGVSLVMQWTYSKCQHPWAFGSQNYILSWPVFLVIITDLTVVLGALFLGSVNVSPGSDKENPTDRGGLAVFRDARVDQMLSIASRLEGALDLGLLVTKASRGLISDISLYLVTVICAVSIAQHFQSALCTYISR